MVMLVNNHHLQKALRPFETMSSSRFFDAGFSITILFLEPHFECTRLILTVNVPASDEGQI